MAHERRKHQGARGVVLDTNVYVSALLSGGAPERVVALGRRGRIDVLVSSELNHELLHVLRDKFRWSEARIADVRADLDEFVTWVEPTKRLTVLTGPGEPDNRVLEAALAGPADAIVTGDRHLLDLKRFRRIPILTPRLFLDRYERRNV